MTAPLYETVARRFAGRSVTVTDVAASLGVNETVARATLRDLKAMKLAKGAWNTTKGNTYTISPEHCFDAMLLGKREAEA